MDGRLWFKHFPAVDPERYKIFFRPATMKKLTLIPADFPESYLCSSQRVFESH